ncbi:MAG: hypothetical protein ACREKJ_15265 [Candidatus Rokuibacteriota bacterium]
MLKHPDESEHLDGGAGLQARAPGERAMSIFYIIGVVVVVLFLLGYFGFR